MELCNPRVLICSCNDIFFQVFNLFDRCVEHNFINNNFSKGKIAFLTKKLATTHIHYF